MMDSKKAGEITALILLVLISILAAAGVIKLIALMFFGS